MDLKEIARLLTHDAWCFAEVPEAAARSIKEISFATTAGRTRLSIMTEGPYKSTVGWKTFFEGCIDLHEFRAVDGSIDGVVFTATGETKRRLQQFLASIAPEKAFAIRDIEGFIVRASHAKDPGLSRRVRIVATREP